MPTKPYLVILVNDDHVLLEYVLENNVLLSHKHNFGIKHMESLALNTVAVSKFLDGIFYALEYISLYDRIPTEFRLITPRYATWLKRAIEKKSYAQFYTNGVPVRVTIENNKDTSFNYARHKKAIFSFKV